ncbi:OLC1v1003850C1 [Oldenlandia corymbosa var. corymbosa]|uniref:OLC1v1003850C1 n=1 Tax=Oldenlandia corymbosa var. corymbosa TaxID=529605 RepID=A0AAV1DAX8_OLDCO|nr:OLC1v1003850C1 [Oldenlandia corymbosa var. corymbosa]
MATKAVMQVQSSPSHHLHHIRKNKFGGQDKKEELEREVEVLRKMLDHEEKVHEFLERVYHHRPDGSTSSNSNSGSSSLSIPNFLPPKMKELLAELAMVENEITRLESQISQLKADQLKLQKDQPPPPPKTSLNSYHGSISSPLPNGSKEIPKEKKVAFETKALHFISKAIKGDYNLSDFSISEKVLKPKVSSSSSTNQKKDPIIEEEYFPVNKSNTTIKKSGMLKPSSPMREPRYSTPWRERNSEIPPKVTTSTPPPQVGLEEESIHKWGPNKLSENIMKCLLLIFVRLLRTSRTMELEKSGPLSRSTNFSMSFRAEPNSSIKSGLLVQKDSRQQDPYGIFDSDESITRDIGPYKNLVIFTTSCMDPKCISSSSSLPLFQKLKILLKNLQKVDLRHMAYHQKLAFWINMYNACIMHAFLQHGLPSNTSPEKLLTLLNKATLNIGGTTMAARAIELSILRKPTSLLMKEVLGKGDQSESNKLRERFGFEPYDPNVTFALCCGTRSSPAVKIYTADGVTAELEKSKLEYLQASIIVMSTRRIAIPEHLLLHMHDFAEDIESLMEWVCHQLPTSGSLRKSIVDCFRGIAIGKASTIIDKIPYDFEFQYLLTM